MKIKHLILMLPVILLFYGAKLYSQSTLVSINPNPENGVSYRIHNTFGAQLSNELPQVFTKSISMEHAIKEPVETLNSGKLIYLDIPSKKKIPIYSGVGDTVVLEDSEQVRYYYSHLITKPDIQNLSWKIFKSTTSLGQSLQDKNPYYKSFLLTTSKNDVFLNPLLFLKPNQLDTREKSFQINSVLIESGIYSKFINNEKPLKIPLRNNFNIYIYVFERPKLTLHKALPRTLSITIIDNNTGEKNFERTLNFSSIQNNKINNQLEPQELYRKYSTIKMLKIGNWKEKDRTSNYTVNIKSTSFSGLEDSMSFALSFY